MPWWPKRCLGRPTVATEHTSEDGEYARRPDGSIDLIDLFERRVSKAGPGWKYSADSLRAARLTLATLESRVPITSRQAAEVACICAEQTLFQIEGTALLAARIGRLTKR
jgi:hypothetical protein